MGLKKKEIVTFKYKVHITDIIKLYNNELYNNDSNYVILKTYKIYMNEIENKWKLNYTIDSDIKCPFCQEKCEIKLEKQSRCIDSPMVPKLEICNNCPGYLNFMNQLNSKEIRLENEFQNNGKIYHALYKNKLFIWKNSYDNLINLIYQSVDFREFILDEKELGILNNKFETEYTFNKRIEYILNTTPHVIYNTPTPKNPLYNIDLYREIDNQITNAKEKAKKESENIKFYFPPKEKVYGATRISENGMIEGDTTVIKKNRKIHEDLLPSNHCTRIDDFQNLKKLEYMRFAVIDTSLALHLMKFCDLDTISQLGKINRWWKRVSYMDYIWKYLLERDFVDEYILKYGGYRVIYKKLYIEEQKKNFTEYPAYNPIDPCYGIVK